MNTIEEIQKKIATQIVQARLAEYSGSTLFSQLKNPPQADSSNVEEVLREALVGRSYYNWNNKELPSRINLEEKIGIVIIETLNNLNPNVDKDEVLKAISEVLQEAQSHLNITSKLNPLSLSYCLNDCEKLVKGNFPSTRDTQELRESFKEELERRIGVLNDNQRKEDLSQQERKKFPNKKSNVSSDSMRVELKILKIDPEKRKFNKDLILKLLNDDLMNNPSGKRPEIIKEIIGILKGVDPEQAREISRALLYVKEKVETWDSIDGIKTPNELVVQKLAWFILDLDIPPEQFSRLNTYTYDDSGTRETIRAAMEGRVFSRYYPSFSEAKKAEADEAVRLIQSIRGASRESTELILKEALKTKGVFSGFTFEAKLATYLKKCLELNKMENPENRNNPSTLSALKVFRDRPYTFSSCLESLIKVPEFNNFLAPSLSDDDVESKQSESKKTEPLQVVSRASAPESSATVMKEEIKIVRIDPDKRNENRNIALRIIEELKQYPKEAGGNESLLNNIEKIIRETDPYNATDVRKSFSEVRRLVLNWEMQNGNNDPLYLAEQPLAWFLNSLDSKSENLIQRMMKYSEMGDSNNYRSLLYLHEALHDYKVTHHYSEDNVDVVKAKKLIQDINNIAKDTSLGFKDKQDRIVKLLTENLDNSIWDKLNPDPVILDRYIKKAIEFANLPQSEKIYSERFLNFIFAFNSVSNFKELLDSASEDFHEIINAEMTQDEGYGRSLP